MPLFDRYVIVDWSAASTSKTGKDSVWIACSDHEELLECPGGPNPSTRKKAMVTIKSICLEAVKAKQKLFVGFDFGLGYPAGSAKKMTGEASWKTVWSVFASRFEEAQDFAARRFEIANEMNRDHFKSKGPFWRYPGGEAGTARKGKDGCHPDPYPNLCFRKPDFARIGVKERRHCEASIPRAKSNWELLNPGSVGSQTLLGIAALGRLIADPELAGEISVWPFDTEFTKAKSAFKSITLAEVYPSAFSLAYPYDNSDKENPVDHAQVKTLAHGFACLDRQGRFEALLEQPESLKDVALEEVLLEEGWIVGVSNQFDTLKDAISGSPA